MDKVNEELKSYHASVVKKNRRKKLLIFFFQLLIIMIFFIAWELLSHRKIIDPLLFSSPTKIYDLLSTKLGDGSIYHDALTTITETLVGFILGTILGVILAIFLWWYPFASKVLDPFLVVFNAMPKVALGPIIIVIFGPSYSSIIAMGIIISFVITALVIYQAFLQVDENYVKVIKSFGATKTQIFKNVIFPASVPTVISTLKVNVGLAWVGVIVGEFLVSKNGLGYLIVYGFQVFNFTLVLMSVGIISVCAGLMYIIVEFIERKTINK
ncbi:ABC transporter permease [Bacillus sp. AFS055030]|uniref:ABC transporter permease n=1 Tax=Bacillus sp. AFS055030 TaxID=2033507 RepID=UPI000BFB7977|nr:ABC transporter permease [Bacillus sp. AFS055030]PGL66882.1 ABC transporter permease [Bacillus sp. AFS055030]